MVILRQMRMLAAGLAVAAAPEHAVAQFFADIEAALEAPMPLVPEALGEFTHAISSDVPEAQAYFDQGFQLMYAFAKAEAIRSFREAWMRDPECAICYWGEAWAWGSYLNAAMREDEAPYAWAAVRRAVELRDNATPQEQAYIDALAHRYVEHYDIERRREQDEAYARAMQSVHSAYPDEWTLCIARA